MLKKFLLGAVCAMAFCIGMNVTAPQASAEIVKVHTFDDAEKGTKWEYYIDSESIRTDDEGRYYVKVITHKNGTKQTSGFYRYGYKHRGAFQGIFSYFYLSPWSGWGRSGAVETSDFAKAVWKGMQPYMDAQGIKYDEATLKANAPKQDTPMPECCDPTKHHDAGHTMESMGHHAM